MDIRIAKVIELLHANIRGDLDLNNIAREVNLSASRLRHLFKAETGLSPALYLKALRMEKAKELSENSFLRVKEIMNSVGLNNSSHFTKNFKRAHGLTPTEWRNQRALSMQGLLSESTLRSQNRQQTDNQRQ